ncbi:hypothetical protein [Fictibacillus sp. NRS-1165]|uniref:hypothetical protein n=1 Tax=Fictibacillus sp. NRS-1165 TaxID=3144463 RepID=UPI003D1B4A3C
MILKFDGKQIGQMDINFFHHIVPLLKYWGLNWNENYHEIDPAMYGMQFEINGFDQNQLGTVKQLLHHTDVTIDERIYGDKTATITVDCTSDQPVPIIIQTKNSNPLYITPSEKGEQAVQNLIHKSIICKRKADHYSFSFRWREKESIPEWVVYLILQIGISHQFSSLASISTGEYQTVVSHILKSINPMFAELQFLKHKEIEESSTAGTKWRVPDTFNAPKKLIPVRSKPAAVARNSHNAPAISPFKSAQTPASTINPFKEKQAKSSKINPFQPNTYTTKHSKE